MITAIDQGPVVMGDSGLKAGQRQLKLPRVTLLAAVLITFLVGGLSGLFSVLVVVALLFYCGGWDSAAKHGISDVQSCRLGGVILVVYPICFIAFQWFSGNQFTFSQTGLVLAILSLGIFSLGLYEDFTSALSARRRLALMLSGAIILVVASPGLVIEPLGIPFIDALFSYPFLAYPLTVLALAFLPNAFNIADGANGLLSGVSLLALYGLIKVDPGLQGWPIEILWTGCLIFFVLNVITGRLFLGDGGAYFLGLLIGITLIFTANQTEISPWFLAMLIFYPMTDFLFSMMRRVAVGRSAMSADNEHFHNLLFRKYKKLGIRSVVANTMTGVSVAMLWTGAAILLLEIYGSDINWFLVYGLSWVVFLAIWALMKYTDAQVSEA